MAQPTGQQSNAKRAASANRLLQQLYEVTSGELGPAVSVELNAKSRLKDRAIPASYAYFPISAVVSLVTTMEDGTSAEIALIGREGMIGLAGVLGTRQPVASAIVQVTGEAIRISTPALRAARASNPLVRRTLDLYTQARFVQVAQTAACGRLHTVDERLARWLLAIHDRIDGDEFRVSQEFIAGMLGVHRPTVSLAFQRLQEQGAIERRGRSIIVANRHALEAVSCECHRVIDLEFDRLLSPVPISTASYRSGTPTSTDVPDAVAMLEGMREIASRLMLAILREQRAREQAEDANRVRDAFLAMASHELRSPLDVILQWCTLLRARPDEPVDHAVAVIERSARTQLALVNDMLDATRAAAFTLAIHPEPLCLGDLAREIVEAIEPAAADKQVVVRLRTAELEPHVSGDPIRLRQVLSNVVTNALKFTGAGGAIDVEVLAEDGHLRCIVRDTGRGIAPSALPHVFERFQRGAAGVDVHGGLGLGLTIARALVELHRGTIGIESPGVDQGTTCTIDLPVLDPAGPSVAPAPVRQTGS